MRDGSHRLGNLVLRGDVYHELFGGDYVLYCVVRCPIVEDKELGEFIAKGQSPGVRLSIRYAMLINRGDNVKRVWN